MPRRRSTRRRWPRCARSSGRWLFDAAPEGRISINGVPVAGARIVIAGDVITIAGSQLLVEEAQPRTLALRRFELEGTDTLAAGRRQRADRWWRRPKTWPSSWARCPASKAPRRARGARVPRSTLNYLAWAMGVLLAGGARRVHAAQAHRARPAGPAMPRCARVGSFSWQSASSVFVFPGRAHVARRAHRLRARRSQGAWSRGPVQARALIHLVKLPGKLEVDTRRRHRGDLRRRRAHRAGARHRRRARRRSHAHLQGAALPRSRRAR